MVGKLLDPTFKPIILSEISTFNVFKMTDVASPMTVRLPNIVVSPFTNRSVTDNVVSKESLIVLISVDKDVSADILAWDSVLRAEEISVDKDVSDDILWVDSVLRDVLRFDEISVDKDVSADILD